MDRENVVFNLNSMSDDVIHWIIRKILSSMKGKPNNSRNRMELTKRLKEYLPSDGETSQIVCDSSNNLDGQPFLVEYVFQRNPKEPFQRIKGIL